METACKASNSVFKPVALNRGEDKNQRYLLVTWFFSALCILCLSALGRPLQHWAFREVGEFGVAVLTGFLLFALGAVAIYWQEKQGVKRGGMKPLLTSLTLVVALVVITVALPQTEERLHFVTFGVFGFFSKKLLPVWLAILAIVILSAGDELFQAWLPDRVGDWRDVVINIMAGVLGSGFAWNGLKK